MRSDTLESAGTIAAAVPFTVVGPISAKVTVSGSGNESVVGESGVYKITAFVSAESLLDPDPDQSYLEAQITKNAQPIFSDAAIFFSISNRSSASCSFLVNLTEGDSVGVSISTRYPALGYADRSLIVEKLGV